MTPVTVTLGRYLAIRAAGSGGFEPAFFDDWWQVLTLPLTLNPNPSPNPSPSPNLVLLVQLSTGKSGAGYSPDTPVMRPAPPAAAIPPSTWCRGDIREIYARYTRDMREVYGRYRCRDPAVHLV